MKFPLIATTLVACAYLPASASAQPLVRPGKWEVSSKFSGLPFGDAGPRTRAVCLSAEALSSLPEKALIDASPPPSDDASAPAQPKCEYSQVRRDGPKSSWSVACESPKMVGTGSATLISPDQVELQEKVDVKMGFMSKSVQHDVTARRVGDCS